MIDINEYDKTIDNAMFLTKVDNIYIMLYTAMMFNDMSRVDHKISDSIMERWQGIANNNKANNRRHMYDQLNVKSTTIDSVNIDDEGNIIVKVTLISRYLDYIIDMTNGKKISGNDQVRVEKVNRLTLKKSKDAKALSEARHCPSCGAHADLSKTGKCPSCGTIFNLEEYDYILEDIIVEN